MLRTTAPRSHGRKRIAVACAAALTIAVVAPLLVTDRGGPDASGATVPSTPQARSAAALPSAYGIWPATAPRSTIRRTAATTVGTQFRTTTSGKVLALRYYSERRPGAVVRMRLFTARGQELAEVRFGTDAPAGWKSRRLRTPVRLHAAQRYVVAYTVPRARVSHRARVFADGRVLRRGALVATGSRVGDRAFPAGRSAAAYFADVTFRPDVFPTAATTGVPAGWEPRRTVDGTYVVDTPGAVVEDLRVNGGIEVAADNVTLRRVEVVGGWIGNLSGSGCTTGLRMHRVSVIPGPDSPGDGAAISTGGYTADRVKIDGLHEGYRVGGEPDGCGPVVVRNSWTRVVRPNPCGDWHGDAIQGYLGNALTVRNSVFVLHGTQDCTGTSPFFYPGGQGNTSVDIDGMIVRGGGYSFRLGTPGTVRNLNVVADSYWFGPHEVRCDLVSVWDAHLVRLDGGQPVSRRGLTCD